MNKREYLAPTMYDYDIRVEAGFEASATDENWGLPGEDLVTNDYGEF